MNVFKVTFNVKELSLAPTIEVKTVKTLDELKIAYKGHFMGKPKIVQVA